MLPPGAIPGVVDHPEGGLTTVLEGLRDLNIPCAKVLSVAGFSSLLGGFPLGDWVIPEVIYTLVYCRFRTVLTLISSFRR